MDTRDIIQIRSQLARGLPYRAKVATLSGSAWLYLVPIMSSPQGLLVCVESEGSWFLDSQSTAPTIWDMVAEGISIPTAEYLYDFLASLLAPPKRERRQWRRLGKKWVQKNQLN